MTTFKVGDRVYVTDYNPFGDTYRIDVITDITPSGQIKLGDTSKKFRDGGHEITKSYNGSTIELLTPELEQKYNLWKMRRIIKNVNWEKIPDWQIEIIYTNLLMKRSPNK